MPGKVLADLAGHSLLWHVWSRVVAAGCCDRVLIASEDPGVVAHARRFGAEAVLTGAAPNGTARVAAVAPPDVAVLNVQGDQPLLDPAHLRALVAALGAGSVVTAVAPLVGDPSDRARVKVDPGPPARFSRTPFPGVDPLVHVGVYAFGPGLVQRCAAAPASAGSRAEDLEQLAWIDAGIEVRTVRVDHAAPSVDTPDDLARVRWLVGQTDSPPSTTKT